MNKMSLPPGFRFHPTDVELVLYFLKRKIMGKKLHTEAIAEVDIYKFDPWDLPEKSCLQSRDREWYFFCPQNRRYTNGSRTSRATSIGYWKTTGNDRSVCHNSRTVGMKKTLIFHSGRAPNGVRTNWVMHEYRVEGKNFIDTGFSQDAYVLCKLFEKSGLGPRNGEEHGAPFIEDEWDDEPDNASAVVLPTFSSDQSSLFNPILVPGAYKTVDDHTSLLNAAQLETSGADNVQQHPVDSPGLVEYLANFFYDDENCTFDMQQNTNEVHSQLTGLYVQESNMEKITALDGPELPASHDLVNVQNPYGFGEMHFSDKSASKCELQLAHENEMPFCNNLPNEWDLQQDLLKIDQEYGMAISNHFGNVSNLQQLLLESNYEHNIASSEPYVELKDLLYPIWDENIALVNGTNILAGSSVFEILDNANVTTYTRSGSVTTASEVNGSAGNSSWHYAADLASSGPDAREQCTHSSLNTHITF